MQTRTLKFSLLAFLLCSTSILACWMSSTSSTHQTKDGKRKIYVTFKTEKSTDPCRIRVYEDENEEPWAIDVVNEVAPWRVDVSSDGKYLVTVGNWYGKEVKNDVFAIYTKGGLVKRFAVKDVMGPKADDVKKMPRISTGNNWLTDSYSFFLDNEHYAFWFQLHKTWSVINLKDGSKLPTGDALKGKLRIKLLTTLHKDISKVDAYDRDHHFKIMAHFGGEKDAAILKKLLTRKMDFDNHLFEVQASKSVLKYSERFREDIEKTLALVEGVAKNHKGERTSEINRVVANRYHGSINIQTTMPEQLPHNGGEIVYYLTPLNSIPDTKDEVIMRINLHSNFPYYIKDRGGKLPRHIDLRVKTLPPRKYKLSGFWANDSDCAVPYDKPENFIAIGKPIEFEVKVGKETKAVMTFDAVKK